eukprot:1382263-Pleurochrysis_carterae.AAC.3
MAVVRQLSQIHSHQRVLVFARGSLQADRADVHGYVRRAVRRLAPIWSGSGAIQRTWNKAGMQRRQHSLRRRNAGVDVDRPNHEAGCGLRLLRTLDGCQWCRIALRTGSGRQQCHRGVGRVQKRGAERDANVQQRLPRGQQCARREGASAAPLPR